MQNDTASENTITASVEAVDKKEQYAKNEGGVELSKETLESWKDGVKYAPPSGIRLS